MSKHKTGDRSETGILDRIVAARLERIAQTKQDRPLSEVRAALADAAPVTPFREALESRPGISVIAEMKRSSPSAGALDSELDPVMRAGMYCSAGAAAISVLTEPDFFGGSNTDLRKVKRVAGQHGVAVLQKDFVIDEYQVYEARAYGADAILLIIAILTPEMYGSLLSLAAGLGMDALVEVFDEQELEIALAERPGIVGVNNRNLKTLETSLSVFERIAPSIPAGSLKVAESGMKNAADVARMGQAGAKAVLVGESLMRAGDDAAGLVKAMSRVSVNRAAG
ncbi:MAG: indole-3-glycerol phosphate synthase TrpC [Chloroflexi bacterium]|nr:indole-3-glycerol phosphate synthase TrpC [Chloroflexota bacterium]MDA1296776.1 indole-3-glycerol phosphate synthase TrpC [Chloroflexota bacterium]